MKRGKTDFYHNNPGIVPPPEYGQDDEECYECGGEGYITGPCFEDTCCCADPDDEHGLIPCPVCAGLRN